MPVVATYMHPRRKTCLHAACVVSSGPIWLIHDVNTVFLAKTSAVASSSGVVLAAAFVYILLEVAVSEGCWQEVILHATVDKK